MRPFWYSLKKTRYFLKTNKFPLRVLISHKKYPSSLEYLPSTAFYSIVLFYLRSPMTTNLINLINYILSLINTDILCKFYCINHYSYANKYILQSFLLHMRKNISGGKY